MCFVLVGLAIVFHVQLASGLALLQPDALDPELVRYVLERNHRWFLSSGGESEGFWDPPFFYPERGVGAFTESMLGLQPLYSPWRLAGVESATAYQLTAMAALIACFAAAYALFRRAAGLGPVAAGLAAFLFAFALPRSAQLAHIQLFAHYATPLALLGLHQALGPVGEPGRRRAGVVLFFAAFLVQVAGSLYLAFFLGLAVALGFSFAMLVPMFRRSFWDRFQEARTVWLAGTAVTIAVLVVFLQPYFAASGQASRLATETMLPRIQSFLFGGFGSWESHALGIDTWWRIAVVPFNWEQALSPGLATLALAGCGFWRRRRSPLALLVLGAAGLTLAVTLRWPGGFSLWHGVELLVPQVEALRAVTRVGLLLLLPAGLGVAWAFESLSAHRGRWVAALVLALVVLEQAQRQGSFDKAATVRRSRELAALLPEQCDAFLYAPLQPRTPATSFEQLEAMFAGLEAGVPTLNGYSGYAPAGWWERTRDFFLDDAPPARLPELAGDLRSQGAPVERLCWLRVALGNEGPRGGFRAWTMPPDGPGGHETAVVERFGSPAFWEPGEGRIFADGFETGDVSRWSSSGDPHQPFDPGSSRQ